MKALLYVSLLAVATPTLVFGQGRFSVSAIISPTQRKLDVISKFYDSTPDVSSARVIANDKGGTVGLTANYQFHRNWSVSSGLWYNRSTGHMDFQAFKNEIAYDPEPTRRTIYNNLQLPVLINFSPSKPRLSPYLSTGLVFNMNYRSAIGPYPNANDLTVARSNEVTTNVLVGLGAQYRINSRWSVIVQPTALYRLQKLKSKSNGYLMRHEYGHYRDWQVGVQAQVKYTF
ncbi:outer membrane beta-barrel protein [Larkinella sp. C7]|uniref:outer membrane beta-barrel protein n=1 Tax=Larkinella sp. C7 TaxID=2576607 RepID=UPI0011115CAB|nr:outer membrane beta-barrel protein [Larkinella sp. C7]